MQEGNLEKQSKKLTLSTVALRNREGFLGFFSVSGALLALRFKEEEEEEEGGLLLTLAIVKLSNE